MDYVQISEALRTARDYDEGDVYLIDADGDYCKVQAVEVHQVGSRRLLVIIPDYDNYVTAGEVGDNAGASETDDQAGDPALTIDEGDQSGGSQPEPGSIPGAV